MSKDLYRVLGVARGADQDSIKKAYKDLARRFHPDRNPSPAVADRFKEINAAYDVLGDAEKRRLYDEFGDVSLKPGFDADQARRFGGGGFGGFGGGAQDLNDILNGMFGGGRPGGGRPGGFGGAPGGGFGGGFGGGPGGGFGGGFGGRPGGPGGGFRNPGGRRDAKGRDLEGDVHVSLGTLLRGEAVEVNVRRPAYHDDGSVSVQNRSLKVRIPDNVDEGGVIRLRGKGAPGRGGAPAGDLLLKVHLTPHPFLRRQGSDLYMDVPITIGEALTGGRVEVPTVDGPVRVRVPAGATSGTKMRIRGKGVRKGSGRGDLYLVLRPTVPATDDPAALELAEQLDAFYEGDVRADLEI